MIKIKSLRIDYDDVTAVSDLNLEIKSGQIFGLVGPNGAGKTSTIKACAGIIEPTYGEIKINGSDLELNPIDTLKQIGYMPDFSPVYENLKVWEYLDVFAAAYRIPREQRLSKVKYWIDQVNLTDKYEAMIKTLSRGMRQRLVLAKTLLPDPKVLLLDEPASGLDPNSRRDMRDILLNVAQHNKTIIISSHILTELSGFCNSVGIMEKGNMVVAGSMEEIRNKINAKAKLHIRLSQSNSNSVEDLLEFAKNSEHISNFKQNSSTEFSGHFQGSPENASWILAQLIKQDIPVCDYYIDKISVEDIFFQIGANEVS